MYEAQLREDKHLKKRLSEEGEVRERGRPAS